MPTPLTDKAMPAPARKHIPLACGAAIFMILSACPDPGKHTDAAEPSTTTTAPSPATSRASSHEAAVPIGEARTGEDARCPPGKFFVHGGCFSGDDVGEAGPPQKDTRAVEPATKKP